MTTTDSIQISKQDLQMPFADLIDKPAVALIREIKSGLAFNHLSFLTKILDVSHERLGYSLNITKRTLIRRKEQGRLTQEESERLVRLYKIFQKALDVFIGDIDYVKLWMKNPKKALGGEIPIDFAETDIGAQEVLQLLGRIDHGVFS